MTNTFNFHINDKNVFFFFFFFFVGNHFKSLKIHYVMKIRTPFYFKLKKSEFLILICYFVAKNKGFN